ncbi:CD99 antigen [Plasmodium fragile]|uniref:CD99 antigen n=1 Tax=Plasmodium fragile TaxID=5857 RepID=A0A0D9QDB8_PLAFR|nr:CD99 antigen [Plasmodium fragile]KJP85060.1 CD99 antigen [Plasmodium fragile]
MQDKEWEPVKNVLEEFMEYLEEHNDNFDALGANCDNTGWNDLTHTAHHTGQTVADMMRCRLMSGALWFANGSWKTTDRSTKQSQQDDEETNRLRCDVAHVFGHLLKERYCKDKRGYKRGIEYAWQTFRDMNSEGQHGFGEINGPVIEGKCTPCGYTGYHRHITAINLAIAQWLLGDGNINEEITAMEQAMPCDMKWEQYIKEQGTEGNTIKDSVSTEGQQKIEVKQKELAGAVIKIIQKVQEAKDDIMNTATEIIETAKTAIADGQKPEASTPKVPAAPKQRPAPGGTGGQVPPEVSVEKKTSADPTPVQKQPENDQKEGEKGKGKKHETQEKCQGEKILDWRPRTIYVEHGYSDKEWEPVKNVLEEFMEYLEEHNDNFDALGANCDNTGWNDLTHTAHHTGQTVADMMRCRLMSGALWFANGSWKTTDRSTKQSQQDDEETNRLRCDVAHVFGHLLKERYCKDKRGYKRGIEYAWQTFRDMNSEGQHGFGEINGPVIEGKCTPCGYTGYHRHITAINLAIAQWLLGDGNINEEITAMEQAMPCDMKWEQYIKEQGTEGNTIKDSVSTEGQQKIEVKQKELAGAVIKIIQKVQEAKDDIMNTATEIIETAKTAIADGQKPEASTPKVPAAPKQRPAPGGTGGQVPPEVSVEKKTSADPTPVQKQPENDQKEGKTPGPSCGPTTRTDKKADTDGNSVTVEIHFSGSSSSSECSGKADASAPKTSVQQEDAKSPQSGPPPPAAPPVTISTDPQPTHTVGNPLQATVAVPNTEAHGTPGVSGAVDNQSGEATTTDNGGSISTPHETSEPKVKGDTGQSTPGKESDPAPAPTAQDAVIDGGNDDPPPLNPPKPKPNPNADQSGSSGSFSDADLADGVSGGEGKGGADGGGSSSSGPGSSGAGSTGDQNAGSSAPGSAGTGGTGTQETLVYFGTSSGTGDECDTTPQDSGPGAAHADSKSKKDTQAPDAGVATNPDGQAHNTSSCTSSEFSCTSGALESVLHTPNDTVTSGGTQSASGGHNAGNAHAGNVDCTANPLHDSCDLRLEVPFVPSVKLSDGHFGPGATPAIRDLNHDGVGKEDVPIDIPDLTDTVLTATTPVLFFLASVTVAILGYSLWKYFAHLGKNRRRTYRTVRDVPSPPLDEEILQHLQRGELPPPDYGYTIVRDRQPASTSGTRRPPRVNRRTIIELHLEVLHECEATEWENVKHDYLQIVVEEFAQELMRDDDTKNNILGVSTSDHGLPGNHVSSTVDPPTDSDGTDRCPPNEEDPDPWSCMETIQFKEEGTPAPFPENVNSRVVCRRSYMWIHYYRICEMRMGST